MTTIWQCPNCHTTVTLHITPTEPPVCANPKHGRRPHQMQPQGTNQ